MEIRTVLLIPFQAVYLFVCLLTHLIVLVEPLGWYQIGIEIWVILTLFPILEGRVKLSPLINYDTTCRFFIYTHITLGNFPLFLFLRSWISTKCCQKLQLHPFVLLVSLQICRIIPICEHRWSIYGKLQNTDERKLEGFHVNECIFHVQGFENSLLLTCQLFPFWSTDSM